MLHSKSFFHIEKDLGKGDVCCVFLACDATRGKGVAVVEDPPSLTV